MLSALVDRDVEDDFDEERDENVIEEEEDDGDVVVVEDVVEDGFGKRKRKRGLSFIEKKRIRLRTISCLPCSLSLRTCSTLMESACHAHFHMCTCHRSMFTFPK